MVVKDLWGYDVRTVEIEPIGIKEAGAMCYVEDVPTWEDAVKFGMTSAKRHGDPIAFVFNKDDYDDLQLSLEEEGHKNKGAGFLISFMGIAVSWAENILPGHLWVPYKEG